jgi:hypothetical protein
MWKIAKKFEFLQLSSQRYNYQKMQVNILLKLVFSSFEMTRTEVVLSVCRWSSETSRQVDKGTMAKIDRCSASCWRSEFPITLMAPRLLYLFRQIPFAHTNFTLTL